MASLAALVLSRLPTSQDVHDDMVVMVLGVQVGGCKRSWWQEDTSVG